MGHCHVYPPTDNVPPLRTKLRMNEQARLAIQNNLEDVKGVKGPTIAAVIPCFDIARSFVPDYMHGLFAGVTSMLMDLWFNGKNHNKPFYISKQSQTLINTIILEVAPPDYIARIPRSLKYRSYFKSSEIRDFLLYYWPIILKDFLPKKYYEHFLVFSYGIRILLQSKVHENELDLAEHLLEMFLMK